MQFTGIIKKAGDCYVGLCLELNIASQGESIEETKNMLQEACEEYLSYTKDILRMLPAAYFWFLDALTWLAMLSSRHTHITITCFFNYSVNCIFSLPNL